MIMALSKARLKELRRLQRKKYRNIDRKLLAEGNKLVSDLIAAGWEPIALYVHTTEDSTRFPSAERINLLERKQLSSQENPSGVLAVFALPDVLDAKQLSTSTLVLYGIQDPGNMGTIMRTASWFGCRQIVLLDGCVDPFNPKVVQSSMGSIAHLQIVVASEADLNQWRADGYTLLAADMYGEDVYGYTWPERWLLLMGNEGQGFSGLGVKRHSITIPRIGNTGPESLNVSIASAVILSARAQKMRH